MVLDTLREDYAGGLDELLKRGFVKYHGAISAAPWTLPSHASMFTGQLPSRHQVHEGRGVFPKDLMRLSSSSLRPSRQNLLNSLSEKGYTRYCLTENPFISPSFGFDFDVYKEYHVYGPVVEGTVPIFYKEATALSKAVSMLKAGKLNTFRVAVAAWIRVQLETALGKPAVDRGSRYLLQDLARIRPSSPFFLFLDLMEAHGPYFWDEDLVAVRRNSALSRDPGRISTRWKNAYGQHARLAVDRALDAVALIEKYDPLTIVTSDHGQLLGEKGRYDHGTFLDDALLRVPLYVKFPEAVEPFHQEKPLISLLEVHKLVTSMVSSVQAELGSDYAFAESFGPMDELSRYLTEENPNAVLSKLYAARVRIYSRDGSVLYNRTDDVVEETEGTLTSGEVTRLVGLGKAIETPDASGAPPTISQADEELVLDRLRRLGYA
ncbi:MAG: sulfatase-like hydrolase/transferase [Nitrososphaerales archaeon]